MYEKRINYYTCTRIREKSTGTVGILVSEKFGGGKERHVFKVYWSDSFTQEEIKESDFYDRCEIINHDYSDITSQVMEFLRSYKSVGRIPQIVARRLDPDYYKIGSVVYFQSPGFLIKNSNYDIYGPEYPMIIKEIIQDCRDEFNFTLVLSSYHHEIFIASGSDLSSLKSEVTIGLNLTHFSDSDAYNNLARYDKEY